MGGSVTGLPTDNLLCKEFIHKGQIITATQLIFLIAITVAGVFWGYGAWVQQSQPAIYWVSHPTGPYLGPMIIGTIAAVIGFLAGGREVKQMFFD